MTYRSNLRKSLAWLALPLALLVHGCAGTDKHPVVGLAEPRANGTEVGLASYYGSEFHGRMTASGVRYDEDKLTAAHRTLPFGTRVQVTNLENDRTVTVRVNDRGPHRKGRIIDLSRRAARALGMIHDGVARVRVEVLDR